MYEVSHLPRWARDHTNGIQQAFFNGAGFESWENVWGIWNRITERHSELLRRAATILRCVAFEYSYFAKGGPESLF